MARNFWRHPVPAARNPRLRLEGLESRVVPAIVQTGLPTWMAAGPFRTTEAQVTGLQGTFSDPVAGA